MLNIHAKSCVGCESMESKLEPQKCNMFKKEVVFLGRVVSEEGYKLDPSSIKPVLSLKESSPKTVNEVRKLMGFLN